MASEQHLGTDLAFGDFVIDRADERVLGPNGPVRLGNKAYRVLLALVGQDGRLLTKDALFSTVWDGTIVSESALTSAVKELRRALGDDPRQPRYIESVYGRGYRFIAPVRPADGKARTANAARAPAAPAVEAMPERAETAPPLVLVAPFNDAAVRERHPHCAPELREEVLSGLARFREIQLVAEEGGGEPVRGQRGYRLSATLLPEGEGVKVMARANRLSDGVVVWSETLSLADTGTAGGVERIVRRIVGSALPAVDEDLFAGLSRATGAFYDRYLLAKRRSLTARSFADAKEAAEALERLIEERPDFGLAYPPLVRLYNTDFGYTGLGSSGRLERARGLALARAGLAADRGNVHAYTVLGYCHLYHGEHDLARTALEQALALNPYNPLRLNEVAAGMVYLGDFARARSLLDMSLHLQPFPDDSFHEDMGRLRLLEGDCDGAEAALASVARGSIFADLYLALCELSLGRGGGRARFVSWRERVEQAWHAPGAPDAPAIADWIRRHHPFRGESGRRLFDAVDSALATDSPAPRSAAPAS